MGEVSRPTVADEFTELTSDVAGGGVISRPIQDTPDRQRRGEFEDPSDRRRAECLKIHPIADTRKESSKFWLSMERSGR